MKSQVSWTRFAVEGLVIVASILMAFGIEAWWNERGEKAHRAELLTALIADFSVTRERLAESRAIGEDYVARGREVLRLTPESPDLPRDSLRFLLRGFFLKIDFEPALSTYEAALGSGDLAFLGSQDFVRATAEFRQARDSYDLQLGLGAQLFFLGPILELRQRLGSLGILVADRDPDCEGWGRNSCYPAAFDLDATAIQRVLLEPEVRGALETVQNVNLNIMMALQRMDDEAALVIDALRAAK